MATISNPDKIKRILQDLTKLTKKSRNIKAIQDISLLKHFRARDSQAVLIMKRFHRVESLGVMWDFYQMKIQKETRMWLKYLNKLRSLSFRHAKLRTQPSARIIADFKKFNLILLRDIHRRRISKLVHSPSLGSRSVNYYALDMRCYPSSVQEMSLDLADCVIALNNHVISMEKFSLLMRLELLFCLELSLILGILKSIPNPQFLTSLGLYLRNRFPEYDEKSLIPIFEFMSNKCPGLKKLDLRITHPTEKLSILKLPNKLSVLNLWIPVKTEIHLQDIGFLLLTVKNLESLDLTIDFDLKSILSNDNFCEFYQILSQLIKLQKLRLNFYPKEETDIRSDYIQYFQTPLSSYLNLMESIACLTFLKELCLQVPSPEKYLQTHQLDETLGKIAPQLQKVTVHIYGQELDVDGNLGVINFLRKTTELRELSISRFSFNKEKNFSDFNEILKGLKNIEKIVLENFKIPSKGDEILGDLVVSMMSKKGMKELKIKHVFQDGVRKAKTGILFPEILKKNPDLRVVKIESQNITHSWFYHPFESFKYE